MMCIPQTIIPVYAPLKLVTVLWSGSADVIKVPYLRCFHGRVPEAFELWALTDDGVHKIHLYARVKLRSVFKENNFQTFFLNAQEFQIPFLGHRYLNASAEFLDVVRVTQHVGSCVDYTPNIFIYS